MPTYKNNRPAVLMLETPPNPAEMTKWREIQPGEYFVAHSESIPERWLSANAEEGPQALPWVTKANDFPSDEVLRGW